MPTLKMGSTTVLTDTTLANAVQDNITRLGTVTNGTLGAVAKGTVTESSGTPTGAILERGSNSNGHYCKYADGTLICQHEISSDSSAGVVWTFPHAYANANVVCGGTSYNSPDRWDVPHANNVSSTTWTFACFIAEAGRSSSGQALSAIGRWY